MCCGYNEEGVTGRLSFFIIIIPFVGGKGPLGLG